MWHLIHEQPRGDIVFKSSKNIKKKCTFFPGSGPVDDNSSEHVGSKPGKDKPGMLIGRMLQSD